MKTRFENRLAGLCAITILLACGCKQQTETTTPESGVAVESEVAIMAAAATLSPTQGNEARGMVTFTKQDGGIRVVVDITGLTPGEHGFHIHEKGDCSAPDASSAGGHFNPTGMPHGAPGAGQHHIGDLGNLTADASGRATLDKVFPFLELNGPISIIGRAVIVHAGRDDLTTQPSGDAGARVACGVIQTK